MIRREPIWSKARINWKLPTSSRKIWRAAGVEIVGDICHNQEGRLLSHIEIQNKFTLPCSFLDAMGLRLSIPLTWHESLTNNCCPEPLQPLGPKVVIGNNEPTDISIFSSKKSGLLRVTGPDEWSDICSRVFSSSRETKLPSFQYKLLNRISPCRVVLKRLRVFPSDQCPFCGALDDLSHFFVLCPSTKLFWQRLHQWIQRIEDLDLENLTTKEVLLGIPTQAPKGIKFNEILMYAKYYIHRQKLFHQGQLSLIQWLQEFRTKLRTD